MADFYTKFVKLESQEAKVVAKTAHDTMTDVRITISVNIYCTIP